MFRVQRLFPAHHPDQPAHAGGVDKSGRTDHRGFIFVLHSALCVLRFLRSRLEQFHRVIESHQPGLGQGERGDQADQFEDDAGPAPARYSAIFARDMALILSILFFGVDSFAQAKIAPITTITRSLLAAAWSRSSDSSPIA